MDSEAAQSEIATTPPAGLWKLAAAIAGHVRLAAAIALGLPLMVLAITFVLQPRFMATTRIVMPQAGAGNSTAVLGQLGVLAGVTGLSSGIKNPTDFYVGVLKSRTVADAIEHRFKFRELYATDTLE